MSAARLCAPAPQPPRSAPALLLVVLVHGAVFAWLLPSWMPDRLPIAPPVVELFEVVDPARTPARPKSAAPETSRASGAEARTQPAAPIAPRIPRQQAAAPVLVREDRRAEPGADVPVATRQQIANVPAIPSPQTAAAAQAVQLAASTAAAIPAPGAGAAGLVPEPRPGAAASEAAPPAPSPPRFDAAYLDNPAPAYPPLSRKAREEGRVLLRVLVQASGLPARFDLQSSSGFERLDRAALAAVARWKFVPARQGADAVAAWVLVPFVFSLKD